MKHPWIRDSRPRFLIGALCALMLLFASLQGAARLPLSDHPGSFHSPSTEVEAWLDAFVEKHFDMRGGAALGVVVVGPALRVERGYGLEDPDGGQKIDPERSLFRAASVSKIFTVAAALREVEAGRLDLAGDIRTALGGLWIGSRPGHPVTLEHLLTHTSGIDEPMFGNVVARPEDLPTLRRHFENRGVNFGRPPGRSIVYSNEGMALAGHLVERSSGEAFDDYVARHLFGPLGMTRATFGENVPVGAREVASGTDGELLIQRPAGAARTTLRDMTLFLEALLDRSGRAFVLSERGRGNMLRTHFRHHPSLPGVALGFFEGDRNGRRYLFHTGASGHRSVLVMLPEEGWGFYLVHSAAETGISVDLRRRFLRAFFDRYFPHSPAAPGRPPPEDGVRPFSATYRPILLPRNRIERLGELALDTSLRRFASGQIEVLLPPFGSERRLFSPTGPLTYKDADGFVLALAEGGEGEPQRFFMSGPLLDPIAFERLSWWQRGSTAAAAFALSLLALAPAPLTLTWRFLSRRRRQREAERPSTMLPGIILALPTASFAAGLLSIAGAALVYLSGPSRLRPYRVEPAVQALQTGIAVMGLLLAATILICAWWWKRSTTVGRVALVLFAAGSAFQLFALFHWNLLPFG